MREAVSTVLILVGAVVLVLGIIALVRGHLDWMRVSSRKSAAWVSAGAFVVMLVGGGVAPPTAKDADTTASPATTTAAPASTSESASATTTAEPVALAAPAAAAAADSPDAATAAQAKLATLEVKGRAPKTGYDRDLFGQAWSDDVTVEGGHNGCDTRNDILRRDLTAITIKPGSNGCTVLTGTIPPG